MRAVYEDIHHVPKIHVHKHSDEAEYLFPWSHSLLEEGEYEGDTSVDALHLYPDEEIKLKASSKYATNEVHSPARLEHTRHGSFEIPDNQIFLMNVGLVGRLTDQRGKVDNQYQRKSSIEPDNSLQAGSEEIPNAELDALLDAASAELPDSSPVELPKANDDGTKVHHRDKTEYVDREDRAIPEHETDVFVDSVFNKEVE